MSTTVGKTTAANNTADTSVSKGNIPPRLLNNLNKALRDGRLKVKIDEMVTPETRRQWGIKGTLTISSGDGKGQYDFGFIIPLWGKDGKIKFDRAFRIVTAKHTYIKKVDSHKYSPIEKLLTEQLGFFHGLGTADKNLEYYLMI